MRLLSASLASLLLAAPAAAQAPSPSWAPWLGCWELTVDAVRDAPTARGALANGAPAARIDRPRVCVTPAEEGGARFATTMGGQPAVEHTTIPDGRPRPIADGECRGTQRAEWSRDGVRMFSRADLTCDGDPGLRRLSGLSLFTSSGTWLDIQVIDIGGRERVRVRRYVRAEGEPAVSGSMRAASVLDVDDVKEASALVSARALEAALVESNAGFNLTATTMIELDDAGVADSVIDLMVALSYPDRFVVERTPRAGGATFANDPFMLGWAFGYPVWYDDFFYSPYYYMPFGYSAYALRSYGGSYLSEASGGPASPQPRPSGAGRVVDGQGYTRVRTREVAIAESDGGGTRRSPVSSAGSDGSAPASSSGTASSGGGYSGGGSSGDTGRTAEPR